MSESPAAVEQGPQYHVGTLVYNRRTLGLLFFWLLWGDLCYMLMESVVPSIMPLRFQRLGASNATIGLLMVTIPGVITSIANPIISFKSDRSRHPWGRRIPYIVYTLPLLVISLIGLGYSDVIARLVVEHYGRYIHLTTKVTEIVTIGFLMVAWTYFNSFVGSVFWYLFNDVVPEFLLARFMSLFRLISTLSASIYNFFIFRYAGAHSGEIMLSISLLYFFGFGLMCIKVKEGKYPPPPVYVGGKVGPIAAAITYFKETLTLGHYWLIFGVSMFSNIAGAMGVFSLFFYQSTGLNLERIGDVNGAVSVAIAVTIPISGILADRYHPIRIVIIGYIATLLLAIPASMVWLFWHPGATIAFYAWLVITVVIGAPAQALLGVFDPPMLMKIFPRSRYGQYCSANAMTRTVTAIAGGVTAGAFLDIAAKFMGHENAYHLIPVWQFFWTLGCLVCMLFLYKSWKKYGGDAHYIAPVPGEALEERKKEEIQESVLTS